MIELGLRGMKCRSEQEFTVEYKGRPIGSHRVDLLVEDKVLLELKAVSGQLSSLFVAQTISERRVTQLDVALHVNFGEISLQVRRLERRDESKADK